MKEYNPTIKHSMVTKENIHNNAHNILLKMFGTLVATVLSNISFVTV